jgi:hypothetical protein
MADRLGLMPWERERLQPNEIHGLYDGLLWRIENEMKLLAAQTWLVRRMIATEEKYEDVLGVLAYHLLDRGTDGA